MGGSSVWKEVPGVLENKGLKGRRKTGWGGERGLENEASGPRGVGLGGRLVCVGVNYKDPRKEIRGRRGGMSEGEGKGWAFLTGEASRGGTLAGEGREDPGIFRWRKYGWRGGCAPHQQRAPADARHHHDAYELAHHLHVVSTGSVR